MGHSYNHNNHLPGVNQYDPYTQQPNINQGYPQYQQPYTQPQRQPWIDKDDKLVWHSVDLQYPTQMISKPHNIPPMGVQHISMLSVPLIDRMEAANNIVHKFYNSQPCGIFYKYYKYENGYVFKYVNNSNQYLLDEEIIFSLENCYIVGASGNRVRFTLPPQYVIYVHVTRSNVNIPFIADIQKINSNVTFC